MNILASIFSSGAFDAQKNDSELTNYLIDGETVDAAFKMAGGYLAVTGRRLIVMHKTGGSRDYLSVPYGRIGSFSAAPKSGFSLSGTSELRIKVQGQTDDLVLEFTDNESFLSVQRGLAALTCPVVG